MYYSKYTCTYLIQAKHSVHMRIRTCMYMEYAHACTWSMHVHGVCTCMYMEYAHACTWSVYMHVHGVCIYTILLSVVSLIILNACI